jgi:membrane protease YdiL (CAAX protease family)
MQTTLYGIEPIGDVIVLITFLYCFRSNHLWTRKHMGNRFNWILTIGMIGAFGTALLATRASINSAVDIGLISSWLWIVFKATWEETIFRGMFLAKFADNQIPARVVWIFLLSTLFFTTAHVGNYIAYNDSRTYMLYVLLSGIVLGQLFIVTRNLIFPSILHAASNIFVNRIPGAMVGLENPSTWIVFGTQVAFIIILTWLWMRKVEAGDFIRLEDESSATYMNQFEQGNSIKQSFRDVWRDFINALKSLNKLMPGCVTVLLAIGVVFVLVTSTFSSSIATIITLGVLIFISVIVYAGTQNYGESALALAAGLLAVFSVQWDGEKAALFLFVWIVFSLIALLIYSVKSAAKNEAIVQEAALALDINNVDRNEKELQKIINDVRQSQLGPLEKADVIRIFAYRKLPITVMPHGLRAVSTLYTISRGEYKTIALFVLDVYQMFSPKDTNEKSYSRLLDRIYNVIRKTPASPIEFIDAFNKSRRFALSSHMVPDEFINAISDGLSVGVSPDEMYDYLTEQSSKIV